MAKHGRDLVGTLLGILVFLGGVALILLTFRLAYDMFTVPPAQAMGVKPGKPINFEAAGVSLATIFVRILLLIVMALMGSWIANRGVHLYAGARGHHDRPKSHDSI